MDLTRMMTDALTDKVMGEISGKMWMGWGATKTAIMAALPMIMGGLSKNADSDDGAAAINKAVEWHDWGIMDMIGGLASNPNSGAWAWILGHILWGSQGNVEKAIAKKAGIDMGQASGVLKVLAPMVMGKLWQAKSGGLNIGLLLQGETATKWILTSFLDQDGDGEITDDLLSMWGSFLKKKFFG